MSTNEQLYLFNKTIFGTFHNFIPNKDITCNNKDPPCFIIHIKILTVKKNNLFKNYRTNGRLDNDYAGVQKAGIELIH